MNLINGECLEELKKIENNSVDCFICDLPFGTTGINWDKRIDLDKLWIEMKRIARNNKTPFFFFCDMKLAVDLINSNRKWFRYDIVVKKTRKVGFLNSKKMPMRIHELLLVFYKNLPLYNLEANHTLTETEIQRDIKEKMGKVYGNGIRNPKKVYGGKGGNTKPKHISTSYDPTLPCSIIEMDNCKGKPYHSTEKAQDVLEWIIKYYTNEGDTILDPTMGSGSTGVACQTLHRNFIGIELDNEYFDVANERINNLNK